MWQGRKRVMVYEKRKIRHDLVYHIMANEYNVTVMSRSNSHCWYMHNLEYSEQGTIIIFYRHSGSLSYHYQRRKKTADSGLVYQEA